MKTKAPRNKTLELNKAQTDNYAARAIKLKKQAELKDVLNQIIWQDAFLALDLLPDNSVDLMIVDPP